MAVRFLIKCMCRFTAISTYSPNFVLHYPIDYKHAYFMYLFKYHNRISNIQKNLCQFFRQYKTTCFFSCTLISLTNFHIQMIYAFAYHIMGRFRPVDCKVKRCAVGNLAIGSNLSRMMVQAKA